jgi:hypothetical protein
MDGKHVPLTNDDTLTPEDVGLGYKAMMIIETYFRRLKTTGLRIRPVYHWTAHRIVSHVKLCVLALLLQQAAELRAGNTWRHMRLASEELKAVRYRVRGTTIAQSTTPTPHAATILKKPRIPPPQRVLAVEHPSPPPVGHSYTHRQRVFSPFTGRVASFSDSGLALSHLFVHAISGMIFRCNPGRAEGARCPAVRPTLGGHLKTGQSWTGQNRPVGRAPQAVRVFYRIAA